MTDAIWIAVIAAVPGLLMTLATIFQVRRVHVLVNSQKDALRHLLQEALITVERLEHSTQSKDEIIDGLRALMVSSGRKHELGLAGEVS